jgi:hypothetical protein
MTRTAQTLDRTQMLRALPKHLMWAALLGAIAGPILYFLKDIELPGKWNLLMAIPIGAVYVNAAVLPIALPGRHWSFGFIASAMLFMLLIAGMIIAPKFPFAHAWTRLKGIVPLLLPAVNTLTWTAIITGGCIGLFYGTLVGRTSAMICSMAIGSAVGYVIGIISMDNFVLEIFRNTSEFDGTRWRFDSPLHFAWQLALMLVILHLGACLGATMGAGSSVSNKQKAEGSKQGANAQ